MTGKEVMIELVKKIELQSIIVMIITLLFGISLIMHAPHVLSGIGFVGLILIAFGTLFSLVSFFTNNLREGYKDIIQELKDTIKTVRSEHSAITKQYRAMLDQSQTITPIKSSSDYAPTHDNIITDT